MALSISKSSLISPSPRIRSPYPTTLMTLYLLALFIPAFINNPATKDTLKTRAPYHGPNCISVYHWHMWVICLFKVNKGIVQRQIKVMFLYSYYCHISYYF